MIRHPRDLLKRLTTRFDEDLETKSLDRNSESGRIRQSIATIAANVAIIRKHNASLANLSLVEISSLRDQHDMFADWLQDRMMQRSSEKKIGALLQPENSRHARMLLAAVRGSTLALREISPSHYTSDEITSVIQDLDELRVHLHSHPHIRSMML